jgi:hypothetical protein
MTGNYLNGIANTPFICSPIMKAIIGENNIPAFMCTDPKLNPQPCVQYHYTHSSLASIVTAHS